VVGGDIGEDESDEIGLDGEFASAAIDQDGEPDGAGAAEIAQGIERGAHGSAGEEDVIDQKERALIDVDVEVGRSDEGARADFGEVVAVEGDVEDAATDLIEAALAENFGEALGENFASGANSNDI
jgi:hypothetical protein